MHTNHQEDYSKIKNKLSNTGNYPSKIDNNNFNSNNFNNSNQNNKIKIKNQPNQLYSLTKRNNSIDELESYTSKFNRIVPWEIGEEMDNESQNFSKIEKIEIFSKKS